jgi:hypothetical protein
MGSVLIITSSRAAKRVITKIKIKKSEKWVNKGGSLSDANANKVVTKIFPRYWILTPFHKLTPHHISM